MYKIEHHLYPDFPDSWRGELDGRTGSLERCQNLIDYWAKYSARLPDCGDFHINENTLLRCWKTDNYWWDGKDERIAIVQEL